MPDRNSDSQGLDLVIDELDVIVVGERAALWLADELVWAEYVRSTHCFHCDGRGYFIVRHGSGRAAYSFPTCWVCGGEGRPRRRAA